MIAAQTLAYLCLAIEDGQNGEFVRVFENDTVCVGLTAINGEKILAFRGSKTLRDWFDDFLATPIAVPLVGTIHEGFWLGVEDIFDQIGLTAGQPIIITGHSLGTAHGALFARLCLLRGIPVSQLYLFAPPRIGYQDFYDGLRNIEDIKAWANGIDPVPCVPISLPNETWCQFPLISIFQPPGGLADFEPTEWHHCELYAQGVS